MQRADRQTLVEIAAAAPLFAEAWANASERTGQRQALGDHLHGAAIIARGDAIDEARNVETRRAARRARRYALAGVIRKQQLQRHFAGGAYVGAVSRDGHALRNGHRAGG